MNDILNIGMCKYVVWKNDWACNQTKVEEGNNRLFIGEKGRGRLSGKNYLFRMKDEGEQTERCLKQNINLPHT